MWDQFVRNSIHASRTIVPMESLRQTQAEREFRGFIHTCEVTFVFIVWDKVASLNVQHRLRRPHGFAFTHSFLLPPCVFPSPSARRGLLCQCVAVGGGAGGGDACAKKKKCTAASYGDRHRRERNSSPGEVQVLREAIRDRVPPRWPISSHTFVQMQRNTQPCCYKLMQQGRNNAKLHLQKKKKETTRRSVGLYPQNIFSPSVSTITREAGGRDGSQGQAEKSSNT